MSNCRKYAISDCKNTQSFANIRHISRFSPTLRLSSTLLLAKTPTIMTEIALKRAYEPASPDDGYRVLVDRLWPRGMSHATLHYDLWEKELAPSTELREWYHLDPDHRWDEFATRYAAELRANPDFPGFVRQLGEHKKVTLLFGSHDTAHNNAIVLRDLIAAALTPA